MTTPPAAETKKPAPAQIKAPPVEEKPAPTVSKPSAETPAPVQPTTTVAAKPATTIAAAGTGAFVLQIGAYKSEADATAAWHAYQAKHPLVAGSGTDIMKVDLGPKGTWYRLRVGSFDDKAAAAAMCQKLKADGGDCLTAKR
jgi:cell division protein FtsN